MAVTYYVVVPFGRSEDGDLVPLEPMEAPNGEAACRRASALAAKHGGATHHRNDRPERSASRTRPR